MALVSGSKDAAHRQSVVVNETRGPATAFDPDEDDDKYSVSEYSTAGKSSKKYNVDDADMYYRATLSRRPPLERMESTYAVMQSQAKESQAKCENGKVKDDTSPEGSNSHHSDLGAFPPEPEDIDAPVPSSFSVFAQTRFQLKIPASYGCSALPMPLLPKQDKRDHLAALASWILILRIMGDLPEPDLSHVLQLPGDQPPVISRVKECFKKRYTKKELEEAQKKYSELFRDITGSEEKNLPFINDSRETMLEKVQYVCALGIYRTDLRDELYCQLCKQLTNNPSRNSMVRGWVLMMLFAGSFVPSERFAPCFQSFLRDGPSEYAQKVDRILRRTGLVGTRSFPPSWLEFQAAKNNKPILLPVTFMNGDRLLLEVDAASTVKELCWQITETLDFREKEGFSIYICLQQKISCLGHGMHRVLDAVSECEQHTKGLGMKESSALWRLYFRKEYFTPWHSAINDPAGTDIIYQQIMRGISLGEYKCQNEDVYVLLGAQKYYLEYSDRIDEIQLDFLAKNWFPKEWVEELGSSYFVKKVMEAIKKNFTSKDTTDIAIKSDIVTFAMDKWSLLFSRFYDAAKVTGPGMGWMNIVVGLSGRGVYVLDEDDSIRVHIPFYEIAKVVKTRHTVSFSTVKGEEFIITSHHSEDLNKILTSFLSGLRMRSRYAIVIHDYKQLETATGLSLVQSDLIVLDEPFEAFKDKDMYKGVCKRTGKSCDIPSDLLYVIQTVEEPSADMLEVLRRQLIRDQACFAPPESETEHTLQTYARLHFRQATENAVSKLFKSSFKRDKYEGNWKFSKESLKKPLLRRTIFREDVKRVACRCFLGIQQYMGDVPVKEDMSESQLVNDFIIDPARRNRYLREEVFCQLMKQLTNNPNRVSEKRGWHLMMILCTTGIPTSELTDECYRFCRTRKEIHDAQECVKRLSTCNELGCRHYAPQQIEYDMLVKQQPTIRVRLVIPDGTKQTIEVRTLTRIIDIKREACRRLNLSSYEEYSIVLCVAQKVYALSPKSYYFDCLGHAEAFWMTQKHGCKYGLMDVNPEINRSDEEPALVMLKKIWVNIEPGVDQVADKSFHFPQELPNYIHGHHDCTGEEAAKLAAFVYRAKYGSDKRALNSFSEIISSLLPNHLVRTESLEYWKESIVKCYNDNDSGSLTSDAAKTEFLKILSKKQTYGCVFFEVKQRVNKSYPKNITVAINMRGLHLIDPQTKKILITYDFHDIPNWAYDEDSLTLVIMDGSNTSKLLLETKLGHNMDDVIMSYIGWLMNAQMRRKRGFAGSPIGESHC